MGAGVMKFAKTLAKRRALRNNEHLLAEINLVRRGDEAPVNANRRIADFLSQVKKEMQVHSSCVDSLEKQLEPKQPRK